VVLFQITTSIQCIAIATENGFKQGLLGSDALRSYTLSTQIKPMAWHCAVFLVH